MEVEKGINPNCSELVVRLPHWDESDELRSILRELEEVTGWKTGASEHLVDIDEGTFDIAAPVPVKEVRVGEVVDMEDCPYVQIGDVSGLERSKEFNEIIAEKLKYGVSGIGKLLAEGFWCRRQDRAVPRRRQPIGLIPYRKPKVEKVARGNPSSLVHDARVVAHDGYEPHAALKAWQHPYEPHFEPLAETVRALDTRWHTHDGGSPVPFENWCTKNGYSDVVEKHGA